MDMFKRILIHVIKSVDEQKMKCDDVLKLIDKLKKIGVSHISEDRCMLCGSPARYEIVSFHINNGKERESRSKVCPVCITDVDMFRDMVINELTSWRAYVSMKSDTIKEINYDKKN